MIYVDEMKDYGKKGYLAGEWCHMMTDQEDLTELHAMAKMIGLERRYFQKHPYHPHYDLRLSKRTLAVENGAQLVDGITMVNKCSLLLRKRNADVETT